MPKFKYEIYDIADGDINVREVSPEVFELNALVNSWAFHSETKTSKWLIKNFRVDMGGEFVSFACTGTKEELADFCLLRLREEHTNATRSATLTKVLNAVTGSEAKGDYKDLLAERLKRGGFEDEGAWVAHCMLSPRADLSLEALQVKTKDACAETAARKIMSDPGRRADTRAAAIRMLGANKSRQALLEMCTLLEDKSPAYKSEFLPPFREGYPFKERLAVSTIRPILEKQSREFPDASKSIGDIAYAQLKKATKKDFGKDRAKWGECVKAL